MIRVRERPLVSFILTTKDRPRFLETALRCFAHQTYRERELIVVDDGERFPVDPARVAAVGGRLIRAEPGTTLGAKLNLGVAEARGALCQKMDDDDWYAPRFMETMVAGLLERRALVCRPTIAFVTPFLLFEVASWDLRASRPGNIPGATLLFAREDWEAVRFRAVRSHEDLWFLMDLRRLGVELEAVDALEHFIAIRHRAQAGERGHTWTHNPDGEALETHMAQLAVHDAPPEALLPDWAVRFYRQLHAEAAGPLGAAVTA
jgi:glycosyltransferase involved in cell wall biosynthesis